MRKTKTNIQILQQNVLLKQKYMVTFLRQHGPEVFQEMRAAYVETLSRVLSSHFRSYLGALERLQASAHLTRHLLNIPMSYCQVRPTLGQLASPWNLLKTLYD